jgi:predicted transposase/invertase (TIGR01784 family)
MSTFINPFTDFGFKKLFGEESALPRLKSLIEDALKLEKPIRDLRFMSAEQLGARDDERRAVYDVYCTADDGSHFIVELQRAKQHFFKDRTVFYASFPIRAQAQKGDWNYKLDPVYCLGILNFAFSDTEPDCWHHIVQLKNQTGEVFYNKLTFAFLELKKFNKTPEECTCQLDRWCYLLRNMDAISDIPEVLKTDGLIKSAFDESRFMALSAEEQRHYEESLKIYRDLTNVVDTAYDDGVAAMQNERDLAVKLAEAEKARAEEAERRAAEEKVRAEEAGRRAAEEKVRAEEEKARAEEEKARAEEEKARAEEEKARAEALFAELEKLKQGKS